MELGAWQAPGAMLYRIPAVDEVRKWVAMPVQQPEGLVWYVLSLRTPKTPTVIARLKGLGSYGAMSHGVLYTSGNGLLQAVDFGGAVPQASPSALRLAPGAGGPWEGQLWREVFRGQASPSAGACTPQVKLVATFNQSVERYLDPSHQSALATRLKARKPNLSFEFKEQVPIVAGRPALLRIHAVAGIAERGAALTVEISKAGGSSKTLTGTIDVTQKPFDVEAEHLARGPWVTTFALDAKDVREGMTITATVSGAQGTVSEHWSPLVEKAKPTVVWITPMVYQQGRKAHHIAATPADVQAKLETFRSTLEERLKAMAPVGTLSGDVEVKVLNLPTPYKYIESTDGGALVAPLMPLNMKIAYLAKKWGTIIDKLFPNHVESEYASWVSSDKPRIKTSDYILLIVPNVRGGSFDQTKGNLGGKANVISEKTRYAAFLCDSLINGTTLQEYIGTTVMHEIGHTNRLSHVDGNSGCLPVIGPDALFPYSNGTIGVFGWDSFQGSSHVLDGILTHDLMTYCPDRWLSDYHYSKWWIFDKNRPRGALDDNEKPSIRMIKPKIEQLDGTDVIRLNENVVLTFEFECSDNVGVEKIQLWLGDTVIATLENGERSFQFNPKNYTSVQFSTIKAIAHDLSGNHVESQSLLFVPVDYKP